VLIQGSAPKWLRDVSDQTKTKLQESVRKSLVLRAPKNREELWLAIAYRWKMGIARRPVCEHHDAPFDFIDSGFFQKHDRLFAKAAKGSGKTVGFSIIHELNGGFKPRLWTAHVGAIEKQARRCWDYVHDHVQEEGLIGKTVDPLVYEVALDGQPLRSDVRWRNGARLEILAATLGQVSGIHPNVGAADEFELMLWEAWEHFSKTLQETDAGRAQMILGSTHFRLAGPVAKVLDPPDGRPSPFKVVQWCIFEAMSKCSYDCHNVPEHLRMNGSPTCPLWSRIEVKPDGTKQEVEMCHGRAHDGDGHMTPDAIITMYMLSPTMDEWATIMELRKPSKRGMFFPELEDEIHQKAEFEYVPGRPVYLGFDDGFAYPYCLGAWQERSDGFLYQFDELYGTQKVTGDLIEDLKTRAWIADVAPAEDFGGWPDPSARSAIETFNRWFVENGETAKRAGGRPVMRWDTDNDRQQGWKSVRGRLYGMTGRATIGFHPRCVHTYGDLKGLVQEEGKEDCKKVDDHGADQVRYLVHNRDKRLGRKAGFDERRRPEGMLDAMQRQREGEAEDKIKTHWDRLVQLGYQETELRLIDQRYHDDRVGLARALGGLIVDLTMRGRLQRAGMASDVDDERRPGDEEG